MKDKLKSAVLLLDDDQTVLHFLKMNFARHGVEVFAFNNTDQAREFLSTNSNKLKIKIAIIDLFLEGDRGDHLSNNFIRDELIPFQIDYCRLTSAPLLVPEEFMGKEVYDKQIVLSDFESFFESLTIESIN